MELTIAAEIDERPTGDADTDRLLEQIRDEERQHTEALASLRAGAVPRLEADTGGGRAAGSPLADPRPRALAPRLEQLDLRRDLRGQRRPRRRVRARRRLLGGDRRVAPRAHGRPLRGDRLGPLDGDGRLPRRALDGRGRGREPRARARGGARPPRGGEGGALALLPAQGAHRGRGRHDRRRGSRRTRRSSSRRSRPRSWEVRRLQRGDPIEAALAGGLSTALGAIIPVLPFFWLSGDAGVIVAASVSLVAHFAVGRREVAVHAAQRVVGRARDDARRPGRRGRDLPAGAGHRNVAAQPRTQARRGHRPAAPAVLARRTGVRERRALGRRRVVAVVTRGGRSRRPWGRTPRAGCNSTFSARPVVVNGHNPATPCHVRVMAQRQTDSFSLLGMLATRALESQYLTACGEPPRGVRAFRDGPNLLLVLRPGPGGGNGFECETVPAHIAESVRLRCGRELPRRALAQRAGSGHRNVRLRPPGARAGRRGAGAPLAEAAAPVWGARRGRSARRNCTAEGACASVAGMSARHAIVDGSTTHGAGGG